MATKLLRCCICPKRPDFSDTSHLLTHVSSKGHLSCLHKLQVRSHQDLAAGQQLVEYNQWFLGHNVAHMLSERMQQKEKKQAKRKADNKRRLATPKQDLGAELDPNLFLDPKRAVVESYGYTTVDTPGYEKVQHVSANPSIDMHLSTPVFGNGNKSYPTLHNRNVSSTSYDSRSSQVSQTQLEHVSERSTPEMARLKGTIWPGMDIFDSADAETQRKRNQRKDVSVVERMRSMSERVEPMEVVCSPGGTIRKTRHMDDLENDSPVEGETPAIKQSSKRKRKVLAPISKNTSRLTLRSTKQTLSVPNSFFTPTKSVPTLAGGRVSDRPCSSLFRDPFVSQRIPENATDHGQEEHEFQIFDERALDPRTLLTNDTLLSSFLDTDKRHTQRRQIVRPSMTWIQSSQQPDQLDDPFKDFRSMHFMTDAYNTAIGGKESVNPLTWQKESKEIVPSPGPTMFSHFDDFDDTLDSLAEVYAFTRNPLTAMTPQYGANPRTPFKSLSGERDYSGRKMSACR